MKPALLWVLMLAGMRIVLADEAAGAAPPAAARPAAEQDWRARFADPPARYRILPIIHGAPAKPQEQDKRLDQLAARGFGGFVTNVSFAGYFQDEAQWQAFVRFVQEGKKRGMAMWLYDEKGYPSGNMGGLTLKAHPEWEAAGLLIAQAGAAGDVAELDLPPGQLLRAAAFPIEAGAINLDKAIDLAGCVQGSKLRWAQPRQGWRIIAITRGRLYEGTHASANVFEHVPYINIMQDGPGKWFAQSTYGGYEARLGKDLGHYFISSFTDEPSLMSFMLRPMPYKLLPWSPDFAKQFKARRGYDLEPLICAVITAAGPRTAKVRHDFWLTVAELTGENFFEPIRQECHRRNLQSGGHLLLEEPLLTHVPNYGDLFRCEKLMDCPSLDCLTSIPKDVHWYSARLVASAGEMIGRSDNMCETSDHSQRYRPKGDTRPPVVVTEEQVRGTCNRLIVSGITCITSYYRFDQFKDDQLQRINQWVGRLCASVHGGRQATDIAMVYPIHSVWPVFEPSKHFTGDCPPAAKRIEQVYRKAADAMFFNQRDFVFIDADALAESKVERGQLKYRDHAWRVVVLPAVSTLPTRAWENLEAFWRTGGAIVAIGDAPANSEREFPSPAVQAIGRRILSDGAPETARFAGNDAGGLGAYLPAGETARLPAVLNAIVEPDLVTAAGATIRYTHRRIAGQEVFLLINDEDKTWEGQVSLCAQGKGWRCDPATGAIAELPDARAISLKLPAFGAVVLRFEQPRMPRRLPCSGLPSGN